MRTSRGILFVGLVALAGCYPSWPDQFSPAQEYERLVFKQQDPVSGDTLRSMSFARAMTVYKSYFNRSSCYLNAVLIKTGPRADPEYRMQIAISCPPSEWPVSEQAYIKIDGTLHELDLVPTGDVATNTTYTQRMDEAYVSISESRNTRVSAEFGYGILEGIKPGSQVLFVFYTGLLPVLYYWNENEIKLAVALART